MGKINKMQLLKIVNPLLFTAALLQLATMIMFITGLYFSWLSSFHVLNGFILSVLIAIHIYLNWTWIKNTLFKSV